MIEIKQLSFGYKKKNPIFHKLSLTVKKGRVTGLLGVNGTGKSTLLYLMSGLLRPWQGEVLLHDTNVAERRPSTLQKMFIVPEEFELPDITLKKYAKVTAPFYPKFSHEQLISCLNVFNMPEDIRLGELSMGQKKKAFICFALATNVDFLALDEPTNGLDIPSKSRFRKAIAMGMSDEKSVIISTHQVRDIDSMLDHIVIIDGNNVLLNADTEQISDKLLFTDRSSEEEGEEVIFAQPGINGNNILMRNTGGRESRIDIELLFNATLSEREKIAKLFRE